MVKRPGGISLAFLSLLTACATGAGAPPPAGPGTDAGSRAAATTPPATNAPASASAPAEAWGCAQPQPGHPTPAERRAFVEEVGGLATEAERRHGVPAAALTAMAVQESGYGWTRMAQESNNLLAWKHVPGPAVGGRGFWVLDCPEQRANDRFVVFRDRAEAVNFVAEQLATSDNFRADTERYRRDRRDGVAVPEAVDRWLDAVADPYSASPDDYRRDIRRVMNDPYRPADQRAPERNLYRLSGPVEARAPERPAPTTQNPPATREQSAPAAPATGNPAPPRR